MPIKPFFLYAVAFVSGLSVMAIELSASRLIAPYFGTSLFVWTNVIGVILAALSLGYYLGGKLSEREPNPKTLLSIIGVSSLSLLAIPLLAPRLGMTSFEQVFIFHSASASIFVGSFFMTLALFFLPIMLLGMTSPYVIKLLSFDPTALGDKSGKVFAVSTIGSILGTFLPTLVTIPIIGTRATIILFAALLGSFAAGGLFSRRYFFLALIPLALSALVYSRQPPARAVGLLEIKESPYQYIRVMKRNGLRLLVYNEGGGVQSAYRAGSLSVGADTYFDAMAHLPAIISAPRPRVLIIGLAGGTIARSISNLYPAAEITGVEIDPEVVRLAKKWMALDDEKIQVRIADGRQFLTRTREIFDIIVVDAYSNQYYIPFELATQEFFSLAAAHLAPKGIFAININTTSASSPLFQAIGNTLTGVFSKVFYAHVSNSYNHLMIAGTDFNFDKLRSITKGPLELRQSAQRVAERVVEYTPNNQAIFTDDRAPVEFMTDRMYYTQYYDQ